MDIEAGKSLGIELGCLAMKLIQKKTREPKSGANPQNDRRGTTRRPMFRIYDIHSAILSGSYPNCSQLANRLSVERKTIQRDITFMRDELKLPIRYKDDLHGYYYDQDVSDFPVFQTSAEDLAGLFLAKTALESVRGTQLADVMQKVFERMTRGMQGKIQFSWSGLDEAFSKKTTPPHPQQVKLFGSLAECILNQVVTTFFYKKLESEKAEPRRVHPLHLGEVDSGWYLIAHDLDRGQLRTFALPRISRLKATTKSFTRPKDFDGAEHMKKSFGIWNVAGDETRQVVRVELKNYAAQLARERRWHPTQELLNLNAKGSRVEIRFEVGRLEEVLRWVLSFGSHAKVLGPPDLINMVKAEIRAMQNR
jgi:predicted DNA-binding transcriptional regulator YafY